MDSLAERSDRVPAARAKRTLLDRLQRNTVRIFTRPVRKRLIPELHEDDVEDLMEFAGLRREEVEQYLRRSSGRRYSDELDWLRPATAEEYGWFYRGSRTYLFCVGDAWDRAVEIARPGWRTLDFGGGGGRTALALAAKGADACYVDIGIVNAAFVAFRARKRRLRLTVIDPLIEIDGRWQVDTAEAARRVGDFDLIVCDNVLEHVPDYPRVLSKLAAALKPTGRILECTPWKREKSYLFKRVPEWDIHLPQTQAMDEAMRACGMRPVAGSNAPGSNAGLWERIPC
jgi:2-polyprenyl-3-methyl-5-hydroxy-6-metoxy-1,4-benzoquinol methylase